MLPLSITVQITHIFGENLVLNLVPDVASLPENFVKTITLENQHSDLVSNLGLVILFGTNGSSRCMMIKNSWDIIV